jgi:hypothetical protein
VTSCGSYTCGPTACLTTCQTDAQCTGGTFCGGGHCAPKPPDVGAACMSDGDCAQGNCVDGYCCDRACAGQCEACNLPNLNAPCPPVTGARGGARAARATDGTACGGVCDGVAPTCSYPAASATCRAASCADGVATSAASCDGAGHCPRAITSACPSHACALTACAPVATDAGDGAPPDAPAPPDDAGPAPDGASADAGCRTPMGRTPVPRPDAAAESSSRRTRRDRSHAPAHSRSSRSAAVVADVGRKALRRRATSIGSSWRRPPSSRSTERSRPGCRCREPQLKYAQHDRVPSAKR